jgi:ABC-2 type transport system ATP-binding protein
MTGPGFGAPDQLAPIELIEPLEPEGPAPAVQTFALSKRYGSVQAVDALDLAVPAGEVFGLIGPNGAGKTTTFSILASLLRPSSGRAQVAGIDVRDDPQKVRAKVGYMPDILGVYDSLQVDEYLRFFASSYRIRKAEWPALIDGLLELVDLTGKRSAMVNSLSRGMKQRLSLARALVHDPEVLILDEPASGLDPRARVELRELLHELRSMGKTLLVSSHILSELEEMCTLIGIMEAGKLLVSGAPQQILDQAHSTRRIKVRFADGESEEHTVADDAEQQALLRRLVVDGHRDVVEFAEVGGGLEELFLKITQGIVQ